jgi:molybdopterin-guanine dinucleotide biosynthesis protein A
MVAAVLLAGGLAKRLGGVDKGRSEIEGVSVIGRVLDRLRPQAQPIALNANGRLERFADLAIPVITDPIPGHLGPLVGVLAGMRWAIASAPNEPALLSAPTDCPFLPFDLVARLASARDASGAAIAIASSLGRSHPVVALWPVSLADALEAAINADGIRRVDQFQKRYKTLAVDFPALPVDPFFNVNTPEELEEARRLATFERA